LPTEVQTIETLVSQGRYLEARSRAEEALKSEASDRLKQLYALALSKSGAPLQGKELLEPLLYRDPIDPETAGIMGGILKELFKKTEKQEYALQSRDVYVRNFQLTGNYYPGINAASMSFLAGQAKRGKDIAREVITKINPETNDFWETATLGEALLLTGQTAKASEYFLKARNLIESDWGRLGSVYNQLWLLNHYLPVPREILRAFHPPGIAAFIGHMIDHPSRATPRFPAYAEPLARAAIASALRTVNARIGYCSLACGGDILFCESLVDLGGEINILLCFDRTDFIRESVAFAGEGWVTRFESLEKKAFVHYLTHEKYNGLNGLFALQADSIMGAAIHRASLMQEKPNLITLLSETDLARRKGGTRDSLKSWPIPSTWVNINPDNFRSARQETAPAAPPPPAVEYDQSRPRDVRYLVSIDCSAAMDKLSSQALVPPPEEDKNISYELSDGGLLLAFSSPLEALDYAFALSQELTAKGMLGKVKILLNAGPTYLDSTTGPGKLWGEQCDTIRAATPLMNPGVVFAQSVFAMAISLISDKHPVEYAGAVDIRGVKEEMYRLSEK
jgi:hypothetical protein